MVDHAHFLEFSGCGHCLSAEKSWQMDLSVSVEGTPR